MPRSNSFFWPCCQLCATECTFVANHHALKQEIIASALQTIAIEQAAIAGLTPFVNEDFVAAVEAVHQSAGRLVISGIGKSAIIAQKIVATLNSTGTPALFLHAADAIHGDLGMVQPDDVVMVISKSGESAEIKVLVPFIKRFGNTLIALCGSQSSFLATQANFLIRCDVSEEACPNNLAPTSSTSAQLVMGDAFAVALLKLKDFKPGDFARYHPGGALGKRLYLKVEDLSKLNGKPMVSPESDIKETILEITQQRLGAVAVVDQNEVLRGVITDGDIRRMLEKYPDWQNLKAGDIMHTSPKTIAGEELAAIALEQMRMHNISQLLVVQDGRFTGMIHLHDLIREGII